MIEQLADAAVTARIVVPPITKIKLDDVPPAMSGGGNHHGGKTVFTF